MRTGISAVIACCALVLATGCGSSSTTTGASAGTTAGASTTASGSTTASTSAAKTTSTAKGTSSAPEIVKVDTTPKFASPSPSAPVQSGTVPIAYRNIAIDPDTVKVKVGSTLVWTDYDDITHNVTSQSGPAHFASANLNEGSKFSYKVTKPGVIHYECTYHPASMNGTIEVVK